MHSLLVTVVAVSVSFLGSAGLGHQVWALLDVVFVVGEHFEVTGAAVRPVVRHHGLAAGLFNGALGLLDPLVEISGDFLPI